MTTSLAWQEIYQLGLVPAIFDPWSASTLSLAMPQSGEHVLDVACGTGVVARLAARYVGSSGRVVGLDANPGMIAVARSLPLPLGASVEWREGDALALPFSEPRFHKVFCQGGLQFMSDRLEALREMHRVLLPGGRLALMVFRDIQYTPGFAAVADSLEHYVSSQASAFIRTPFTLGNAEEVYTLLNKAGLQNIAIHQETKTIHFPSLEKFVRYLIAGSPLGNQIAEDTLSQVMNETGLALQSYINNGELLFPMEAHLAVAKV